MTGKVGRWAMGVLGADDRSPGLDLEPGDEMSGKRALFVAGAVRREFGEQSNVGLLVTSRDFGPSSNRVFSLDTRVKLNRNWVVTGQIMRSFTRTPDGGHFSGPGYFGEVRRSGRHFKFALNYLDLSPDFLSQSGFIKRVDVRQVEQETQYNWRPEGHAIVKFGPIFQALANWNRKGQLQDWTADATFQVEMKGETELKVGHARTYELFDGLSFHKYWTHVSFRTQWLKWFGINAGHAWGTEINYDPVTELLPFLGRASESNLSFTLRPTRRLQFEQSYVFSRFRVDPEVLFGAIPRPTTVFNDHVLRSKLNYQFTRALSARIILDYHGVLPNTSLIALERKKRFNADALITYLINPWTAVYLGYSEAGENLQFDPTTGGSSLRRVASPFLRTDRQFFVRLSYLLHF